MDLTKIGVRPIKKLSQLAEKPIGLNLHNFKCRLLNVDF